KRPRRLCRCGRYRLELTEEQKREREGWNEEVGRRSPGRGGGRRGRNRNEGAGNAAAHEGDAAAQVGPAGAVRRLLRGARPRLLQGRRARRDAEERRTEHHP